MELVLSILCFAGESRVFKKGVTFAASTITTAIMGLLDVLLLKTNLEKLGVDKNALFSDPASYLKDSPLKFTAVRPWLLMIILIVLLPIPIILIAEFFYPFDWMIPAICAASFGVLISIPVLFINSNEELIVDSKGVSFSMKGKTVQTPWTLFNRQGNSDLKASILVKVPINPDYVNDVVMTDKNGKETRGSEIKSNHFNWMLQEEMVALRNFYPFGAADMAEMIRRVALTIGHQQPPST